VNPRIHPVQIFDVKQGRLVPASLVEPVQKKHLDEFETRWRVFPGRGGGETWHWDWGDKYRRIEKEIRYSSFALECDGETQGLMIIELSARSRFPGQASQHVVYVEYIEAAPWNRKDLGGQKFKLTGQVLMAAAVDASINDGNGGRVGLHSLPGAESFYRDICRMTDMGPDRSYSLKHPLSYFEFSEQQAKAFIS